MIFEKNILMNRCIFIFFYNYDVWYEEESGDKALESDEEEFCCCYNIHVTRW